LKRLIAIGLFGLAAFFAVPLIAQDTAVQTEQQQQNGFLAFVQDRISTPERQIHISNIDGVLSSVASIDEITISDEKGVYARINNAKIDWNQTALVFGRLEIRSLTADSIEYLRNPIPAAGSLPSAEAGGFSVPELPVAVVLNNFSVPKVTFGEDVFGLGSQISVAGNLTLQGGSLNTSLDIVRLDGPGGTLALKVDFRKETGNIDLAVKLTEPKGGIVANLLNIEGRPDIALSITGSGPVADLKTQMTLDAGGVRALSGVATINQKPEGFAVAADLRGPIATLIAEPYRPFFGAETSLVANALIRSEGGVTISGLKLSGGQLSLEAAAETTKDNFLRKLQLNAVIADPAGGLVTLPVAGSATQLGSAQLAVDFGTTGSEDWSGNLAITGFQTPGFAAQNIKFGLSGIAANLDDPATRRVTFNGDGTASGIAPSSPEVSAALGDSIGIGLAGLWNAGQPLELAQLRIVGKALTVGLKGTIDNFVYDGDVSIETSSIAPFSGLAGRELSGALVLAANGTITPLIGGFDLTLDGTGTDLQIGDETADAILAGEVRLTGRVARTETGLAAEKFTIGNKQVQLVADGTFATGAADFSFNLALADLGLLSKDASGALSVVGTAKGKDGPIALNLDAKVAKGTLAKRPLTDASVNFTGTLADANLAGNVTGAAFLDGFRVDLASAISANADQRHLQGLVFNAGPTAIKGDILQDKAGLLTGNLSLVSPNITTAAALALIDAKGAANATINLMPVDGKQNADIVADISGLSANDTRIGSADLKASITDLFGIPQIDGTINGADISAAGVDITKLAATASRTGNVTAFDATASLKTGTDLALTGSLAPEGKGYRLGLDRVELVQGQLSARLAQPTVLVVNGSNVSLNDVRFNVGSGSITATGSAGDQLDIALTVNALPLSIANAIQPDLQLAGTVNGNARITGSGSSPQVSFDIAGQGINAAAISSFGVTPMTIAANGTFANNIVRLSALRANGTGGLTISGSGTVPLAGNGLNVNLTGSAPLSLANRFVADRGGQASGTLNLDASITGSISAPRFGGTISTSGAQYIDPPLNLRLQNITGRATLSGTNINIDSLSADLATGGSISASGPISFDGASNLAVRLNSARYADGNLFVATISGNLALTGSLSNNPLLAGDLQVERADISVPEQLGGGAALIDVKHVQPRPAVEATIARARADKRTTQTGTSSSTLRLNININAPNQIFIRGRGLDAEVGGSVRLTGSIGDIQPVGDFTLNRGRLSILGQRITFESGTVTLVGNLDPFLNFVARTEGQDITVFVTVSGRASDVDIAFTSNPVLPQDEVLSRLIFNRSMGELSPLQVARLAGAAAELAGGSNSSLLDSLRASTGLADLDIVTDSNGNVAVQAGTYIQDNVYLGVQAGANGQSRVTVNLDITDNVKAKATAGADGDSSLGIFYEKDY